MKANPRGSGKSAAQAPAARSEVITVSKKPVRINLTSQQSSKLLQEVFSNVRLSGEQRRRAVRKEFPLPTDGSRVDLFCEGKFVGAV
jgi:hypothetical protein